MLGFIIKYAMESRRTIVLVLRSGGDFSFRDVELIARHINGTWKSEIRPRIICLWDNASKPYNLGNIELLPLTNDWPKWWSRMTLYSPEMEQYRPFLYIDLDTAVVGSLEAIFEAIPDPSLFIPLEDFGQKRELATGLAWIPANSRKIDSIWKAWVKEGPGPSRMDYFLRKVVKPDIFWQQITNTIYDFKPRGGGLLSTIPVGATVICFHGKPRIFDVAEASITLDWVRNYTEKEYAAPSLIKTKKKVTVIIPYKVDRGWLKEAIASVPPEVQLLLSQGDGNWPTNFNAALPKAEGEYIKYLHEDDMLTPNCITDSVKALEEQNADFIHGNAIEIEAGKEGHRVIVPVQKYPTVQDLLRKNTIHSATTMYRREIFEKIGSFNEKLNIEEEYEFNLRCLNSGFKIGYCNSELAIYRRHPQQKTRTITKEARKIEKELVKKRYVIC